MLDPRLGLTTTLGPNVSDLETISDTSALGLTNMPNLSYLGLTTIPGPKALGLTTTPDPNALGLTTMFGARPRRLGLTTLCKCTMDQDTIHCILAQWIF